MHFRQSKIGVCADIREMFHRVRIIDTDQDALRFLWKDPKNALKHPFLPPDIYAMDAMIFGARSSPCSSQYVKNVHAQQFRQEFPRAVQAILDYHYVDDFVDTFDGVAEADTICQQVVTILRQGAFELRGFVSNSKELLSALKAHDVEVDMDLCPDKNKVLGLYWDHGEDLFKFKLDMSRITNFYASKPT